jgi:hypothetical protein
VGEEEAGEGGVMAHSVSKKDRLLCWETFVDDMTGDLRWPAFLFDAAQMLSELSGLTVEWWLNREQLNEAEPARQTTMTETEAREFFETMDATDVDIEALIGGDIKPEGVLFLMGVTLIADETKLRACGVRLNRNATDGKRLALQRLELHELSSSASDLWRKQGNPKFSRGELGPSLIQ